VLRLRLFECGFHAAAAAAVFVFYAAAAGVLPWAVTSCLQETAGLQERPESIGYVLQQTRAQANVSAMGCVILLAGTGWLAGKHQACSAVDAFAESVAVFYSG
jgi:hypothetical protein